MKMNYVNPKITDGFGNVWSAVCPECVGEMEVVRPGKVQCNVRSVVKCM
jgi:hypothetical protein